MADVNRGNRPLSPHLSIYRPYLSMVMSICHRITGVGLILAALMLVWWLMAAAAGPGAFATADWWVTSWLGALILFCSAAALWYHLCNGVRHLWWDIGRGFDLEAVRQSGLAVLAAAGALTLVTLIVAIVA